MRAGWGAKDMFCPRMCASLRKLLFCPQIGFLAEDFFVHGWARINTDGLPDGSFYFVHGWAQIYTKGFLAEAIILSTDGHGLTRMGFLTEAFVFAKASRNYGNWGAKKFLFNNISRASGFRAEVYLSTDGHG